MKLNVQKNKYTLFTLVDVLEGGIFDPFDLTEGTDLTILGFSTAIVGKFGLSLSNFALHILTDIGCKNWNHYLKLY